MVKGLLEVQLCQEKRSLHSFASSEPSSFLIVDKEELGLNSDNLFGKGFWEITLAATVVHCVSKSQ